MKSVIIVGGGTAGWLSALYLQQQLNLFSQQTQITVIDSSDIGIVGVGEATVHSLRYFLKTLELDEQAFIDATDATFKLGIRFENWRKPVNGRTHEYWHPFDAQLVSHKGFDIGQLWSAMQFNAEEMCYADYASISPHLALAGRSPKLPNSEPFEAPIPYAYHFDAAKAAAFFKQQALERGVNHTSEKVTSVDTEQAIVKAIHTENGRFQADFYVDCSGFHQLLSKPLTQDNWHSYQHELPCNKAVAIQTDLKPEQTANLYTRSTALKHGWCWKIDLQSRSGNGYVYDGNAITPAQAEQELREFLNINNEVPARHLDMKIGRLKNQWQGNCLAIGLSAGFIEPLESTGIYLIEAGLRRAVELGLAVNATHQHQYNQFMNGLYDELRDFIVLHYCLTDRDDTAFWRTRSDSIMASPRLQQIVNAARSTVITDRDLGASFSLFNQINYRFVLYGMDCLPEAALPGINGMPVEQMQALFKELLQFYQQQLNKHPKA